MKLLVLDGNNILNRAFYGIKLLTTKTGIYTNAIYGFLNMLNKLKEEVSPDAVAIAFDNKAKTFRHEIFEEYKAHRKGMPNELASQIPFLKDILLALGYKLLEVPGFEADDIMGTLAKACDDSQNECVIATGDRDVLQLISKNVTIKMTSTKLGKPCAKLYNEEVVFKEYGLTPKQLTDVKALEGDTSDNIPGIIGIGKKTALTLVKNFGDLDNVYKNLDSEKVRRSIRKNLEEDKRSAYISYELGKIRTDVPIDINIESYIKKRADYKKAIELMSKLELFSIIKKMKATEFLKNKKTDVLDSSNLKIVYEDDCHKILKIIEKNGMADFVVNYINKRITAVAFIIEGNIVVCEQNPKFLKFLEAFLQDDNIKKRTHMSKTLFVACQKMNIKVTGIKFDTAIAAHLLNSGTKKYDLEDLSLEYGRLRGDLSDEKMHLRNLVQEAIRFSKVLSTLVNKIEEFSLNNLLEKIEIPTSNVLASIESEGILVDKKRLEQYSLALSNKISKLEKEIFEAVGKKFNICSSKDLGETLFRDLNLSILPKTKPVMDKILKFRALTKIKTTYCEGILKKLRKNNRIYMVFKQMETNTGRISLVDFDFYDISPETDKELRRFFISKPGCVLIKACYSQIELRILAHISSSKEIITFFKNNEDVHVATASKIFNVPSDVVTETMYRKAKILNFWVINNASEFSLAKSMNITVEKAGNYIERFFSCFPSIKKYVSKTVKFARKMGYVETLFGRRRYIPEMSSSNFNIRSLGQKVAVNMPIHGTTSEIIKLAMIRVYYALEKENLLARIVLQVKNEIIVESSKSDAVRVQEVLIKEMREAVKLKVPLKVSSYCGNTCCGEKLQRNIM
ncbi:MAG: DNA polymerase I [Oscillospiraceae bacterium]|jgi:DNA polymerase-1|nr:DNA polymerase I [Oscillospiraceae bacterium]